jgi:hypothetical protein
MINTEIIQFTEEEYKSHCKELRDMLELQAEVNDKVKKLKDIVKDGSGGERMDYGIKVQKVTVRGSINYNKMVSDWEIDEATLEEFRKAPSEYWKVTSY